jgi:GNAT superfamily N-acetyltransferase
VDQLERWGVDHLHADVSLPAPCCYGVTASWPHLRRILRRAGFVCDGQDEIILLARVDDLPSLEESPERGLTVVRRTGLLGTRFSAILDDREVGFIEVDADLTSGGSLSRLAGWADVGNLHVAEQLRRRGIATWLVGAASDWLRLARVDRLIAYCEPDHVDEHAFLLSCGWRELTRTERD